MCARLRLNTVFDTSTRDDSIFEAPNYTHFRKSSHASASREGAPERDDWATILTNSLPTFKATKSAEWFGEGLPWEFYMMDTVRVIRVLSRTSKSEELHFRLDIPQCNISCTTRIFTLPYIKNWKNRYREYQRHISCQKLKTKTWSIETPSHIVNK